MQIIAAIIWVLSTLGMIYGVALLYKGEPMSMDYKSSIEERLRGSEIALQGVFTAIFSMLIWVVSFGVTFGAI